MYDCIKELFFFFWPQKDNIILLFHTDLFPRVAKLFLHELVPGWGRGCEGETLSPSTTWKFLDLSCTDDQHACDGPRRKKRQKYLSGNTDEGRCARQKAQPAFSRQKAWLKKKRHAAVGRRGKQGKSKGNETLVRKKQSLKKAGKQVLIHTLWSEGKKAGWSGRAVWKKPFILGHAITWCISWKRLGVQTNANRLIISLDQVRIKQQLPTDL